MRRDHDRLTIVVAMVIAIAVHLLGVPALMGLLGGGPAGHGEAAAAVRLPEVPAELPEQERELVLGQERSLVSSVAWIPYEDFQKLVAPESVTEQPAVQTEVEPAPEAPPIVDATPPAPQATEQPTPQSAAVEPTPEQAVSAPVQATTPLPAPDRPDATEPDLLLAERVGEPVPAPPAEITPPMPETPAPRDAAEPSPAPAVAARPTSAPREPREAAPTQRDPVDIDFRTGRVVTPEGLEIRTYKPQISTIAKVTLPANPRVALTFNAQGDVIRVTFLRSTGAANWDSPIEAALYRWKATGPKLAEIDPPFTREFQILLHRLE